MMKERMSFAPAILSVLDSLTADIVLLTSVLELRTAVLLNRPANC
jgi:hypothetical protein